MNAMQSIVGIYKAKCGMRFDREVAEALGINEQTFNKYMKGRSKLPDIAIAKIAEGAQLDAMQVIAATNLTCEKTPEEERPFWLDKLKLTTGQMLLLVATTAQPKARSIRAIFLSWQGFALHPAA